MQFKSQVKPSSWLRILTHLAGLAPLVILGWHYATGRLGFNPVESVIQQTGRIAIVFLLLSLAFTPVHNVFNLPAIKRLRTPLGLYAVFYAALHLAAFALWDYGMNLQLIWNAVLEKPFILVGLLALLILAALALTSPRAVQRKMGKAWKRLHRWVYLAAVLAIAHYLLAIKGNLWRLQGNYTPPLAAASILLVLFLLRWEVVYLPLRRFFHRD